MLHTRVIYGPQRKCESHGLFARPRLIFVDIEKSRPPFATLSIYRICNLEKRVPCETFKILLSSAIATHSLSDSYRQPIVELVKLHTARQEKINSNRLHFSQISVQRSRATVTKNVLFFSEKKKGESARGSRNIRRGLIAHRTQSCKEEKRLSRSASKIEDRG